MKNVVRPTIVRARVKRLEDMPPWLRCCDKMSILIAAFSGCIISVYIDPKLNDHLFCPYCGYHSVNVASLYNVTHGRIIPADAIDIDEGGRLPDSKQPN